MKKIILVCLSLVLFGCGGSSGGGGDSSTKAIVVGADLSGVYKPHSIQCYNSTLTTMTSATTYSGDYDSTMTISGNSIVAVTSSNGCVVNTTASITASSSQITVTDEIVTSATNGSCAIVETLNGTTIAPASLSKTFATNQVVGTLDITYFIDPSTDDIGFYTVYTDGNGGPCFEMLQKQ